MLGILQYEQSLGFLLIVIERLGFFELVRGALLFITFCVESPKSRLLFCVGALPFFTGEGFVHCRRTSRDWRLWGTPIPYT